MNKIDLKLLMTQQALAENRLADDDFESEGVISGDGAPELLVIVQFTGPVAALESAGLTVTTRIDDMVIGSILPANLNALAELESVIRIEGDYPLEEELDVSVAEVNGDDVNSAPGVGTPPQAYTGNGVIIGIIDSGIDFQHPAFLRPDGTTRILSIWDQRLTPTGAESAPRAYPGIGVEYDRATINAALGNANPQSIVRHRNTGSGHGTHVASIAGGSDPNFPGIATGVEFIVVRNSTIVRTVQAMEYIYQMAQALDRPCVINQSQGINEGPHDGTMAVERMIDKFLGPPGRAYIKSAGNASNDNIHWGATIAPGAHVDLTVQIRNVATASNLQTGVVEVWYPHNQQFSVTVTNPGGTAKGPHAQPPAGVPSPDQIENYTSGTNLSIGFSTDIPFNHQNRIRMQLSNSAAAGIEVGNWTIRLTNNGTDAVDFHSWTQRDNHGRIRFSGSPNPTVFTISTPGTAREVIAVGSYVTKTTGGASASEGALSNFSSLGPTVDGRIKPDISAPGEWVKAARSRNANNTQYPPENPGGQFLTIRGTSMATPHVTGAVACLFEHRPSLTQEQVRRGLATTARTDGNTGTGSAVPNNRFGAGKLDVQALLEYDFPASATRTWVRIRSQLYNWTEGDRPPTFEIFSNENGRAIIELAFGSSDIPNAPARDPAEPLRYYNTGERLDNISIPNADGSTRTLNIDEQQIVLTGNRATWTMPQELWDAYREELRKSRQTPPTSQMGQMLYYRVRFEPTGGTSATVWPEDASFNASPQNNRMGIISLSSDPLTQVRPDQPAIDAMPRLKDLLEGIWDNRPENDPDRASLVAIFSHRFFTNHIETAIRGKILSLWALAGPARQRLFTLLDRMFITDAGLEMTVLKQPCIRDNTMLIDHLLELTEINPHPDIDGVRASEQMLGDVLEEILDPNGQVNQGRASTCAPTGIQTLLINRNAAEYTRLMRGLLSVDQEAPLANGDVVGPPVAIFRAARYSGDQSRPFYIRTNAELAFQATILKYARGGNFPRYDPDAPPDSPRGINTVFQATIGRGLTFDEIKTALDGLFNVTFQKHDAARPTAALRNQFVTDMQTSPTPMLTVLHWGRPNTEGEKGLHAVVSLRHEANRTFFKNPQYSGTQPPTGAVANGSAENPPRRTDDPTQALESMGDDDLSNWVRAYFKTA